MNISAFLLYVFTTTFTPGPNNIMAMTTAGKYGFKRALRFCLGVAVGFFTLLCLAAAFSALLYKTIPNVEMVMKIIGAVYMVWLAVMIVRDKPHEESEDDKTKALRADSVFTGIVIQFINPKAIIYAVNSMCVYILPHYKTILSIGAFALMLSVISIASLTCWAIGGAAVLRVFSKHKKILNIVLALMLIYCAVALFL